MAAPYNRQAAGGVAAVLALAATCVAGYEGLRNDPYDDVRGTRTVCYGETHGVQERHYGNAECIELLEKSLAKHGSEVLDCLPAELPLPTKAAFVSLAYNAGAPAICASTAAKRARAGDIPGACDAFLAWNKIKTPTGYQVSKGLSNRRSSERALCLRGVGP